MAIFPKKSRKTLNIKEKPAIIDFSKSEGRDSMATQVTVKNGNLDMALRKFKQKVARDGVPSECKKRECYDKPGVRRRNAKKEGIKNARKRDKKERANRD